MRNGPDGGSLSRIAATAGCSRATLYEHFKSKDNLYNVALTNPAVEAFRATAVEIDVTRPRDALLVLARGFASAVLADRQAETLHLLFRGRHHAPDLSVQFFEQGPQRIVAKLAEAFAQLNAAETLHIPDPIIAAEQFMALIRGNMHINALLGVPAQNDPEARDAYIRSSVDLFLRGYRR
ncbi:TetR/AcrR family transcriptional regulator [Cereibacter sp. SYSU M97828]|nr:TetR/AcrR family transcriptional regulator [Cereibacter flavus]